MELQDQQKARVIAMVIPPGYQLMKELMGTKTETATRKIEDRTEIE